MEMILYLSAALSAVAFFILVIYLIKTLKTLQGTLENVSNTLTGLEEQLEGVTSETTILLKKTNALADDIQQKAISLNSAVDAVKDVGQSIQTFNHSLRTVANSVNVQVENNKEKVAQIIQVSNILFELKDKWQARKQAKNEKKEATNANVKQYS